jgi:hypothetical protein
VLPTVKEAIAGQFEAALCMLGACVERCPDELWNRPIANLKFCQVAFHVLFFADYYLEPVEDEFRQQTYHREHPEFFRDYEELEDRPQQHAYEKAELLDYLAHCRRKLQAVLAAETAESLAAPCGFRRRDGISRAELYMLNLRHVQHHAAQLSLRLRLDAGIEIPWVGSAWQENA